jgi:hypothetical protein
LQISAILAPFTDQFSQIPVVVGFCFALQLQRAHLKEIMAKCAHASHATTQKYRNREITSFLIQIKQARAVKNVHAPSIKTHLIKKYSTHPPLFAKLINLKIKKTGPAAAAAAAAQWY